MSANTVLCSGVISCSDQTGKAATKLQSCLYETASILDLLKEYERDPVCPMGEVLSHIRSAQDLFSEQKIRMEASQRALLNLVQEVRDTEQRICRMAEEVSSCASRKDRFSSIVSEVLRVLSWQGEFQNVMSIGKAFSNGREGFTGLVLDAETAETWNRSRRQFEYWRDYQGGDELMQGIAAGTLKLGIGVLSVVGTVAGGGSGAVFYAGVYSGGLQAAGAAVDLWEEVLGYQRFQDGDAAGAANLRKRNTVQSVLREDLSEYREAQAAADLLDALETAALFVSVSSGGWKLAQKTCRYAYGAAAVGQKLTAETVFSAETLSQLAWRMQDDVWNRAITARMAVSSGHYGYFPTMAELALYGSAQRLQSYYLNYQGMSWISSASHGLKLIQQIANQKSAGEIAIQQFVLPGIELVHIPDYRQDSSGVWLPDIFNPDKGGTGITLNDLVGLQKKLQKLTREETWKWMQEVH